MPARKRPRPLLKYLLPFLAACLTFFYAGGMVLFSVLQVLQTVQELRAEEQRFWEELVSLHSDNLALFNVVRQNKLRSRVTSLSFSPSGRYLAAGSDAADVAVFEAVSGRRVARFSGSRAYVLDVVFAPDENTIASAEANGVVRLWGLTEGTLLRSLQGHTEAVTALAFGPDGILLASGSADRTVLVWQWQEGRVLHAYLLNDVVTTLTFSPDGQILAAGDQSGNGWLIQTSENRLLCRWEHPGGISDIRFHPGGQNLYVAEGGSISQQNVEDCSEIAMLTTSEQEPVSKIALSSDGRLLVGVGGVWRQPRIWAWSLPDNTMILANGLPSKVEAFRDVLFDPSGRAFVTGSHDGLIRWWGVK